ncbi:MAG: PQQ-dependent sugar dehydrogenase, partial [bacterium]|nr:PQQ-dependent sugar dehydrogenase [bacterium]
MYQTQKALKTFILLPLLLFSLVFLAAFSSPVSSAPPVEFEKSVLVENLNQPTAFRFLPDGRIFISEKEGAIKVVDNGVISNEPVVTMVVLETDAADERGVLGIEPDPDFANNGYLYIAYTTAQNRDRLSRITVTGNTASIDSEVVLLESDQDGNVFHHGGELKFGPDGKLYWAMGMNTHNPNSQILSNVHGKIHRINTDGTAPADNPFVTNPNVLPSIWAYGLRNPFRFDFLPNGKIIAGDVGGSEWEEVNIIERGANYGWPSVEGICPTCSFVNPLFVYPHTPPPDSSGSVTAALYYTGDVFPPQYSNVFYYGDYTVGFIRYLQLDENYESVISDNLFDDDAGTVVQLTQGPDGNMYQMNFYP